MTQARSLTATLLLTLALNGNAQADSPAATARLKQAAPPFPHLTKLTLDPASVAAQEQLDRWKQANALDTDDSVPYYLKMNFELFDMEGKPVESGTLERWAAPHRSTTVISSPSVHRSPTSAPQPRTRNSYFVDLLLQKILSPIPQFVPTSSDFELTQLDRTFGQLSLHCVAASGSSNSFVVCTDPATDAVRIDTGYGLTTVRNKEGRFEKKPVAMELQISFGTTKAITGSLIELKGIEVNDSHLPPPDAPTILPEHGTRIASGVAAGMKTGGQPPSYPEFARQSRTQGTVVAAGTISKQGRLTSLFVIASPDASLSNAALDALRTWTYKPYLLNGSPVEVETQILVNFYLNDR